MTDNDTPSVVARVPFAITSQTPARATWRLEFQGKAYTGEGYNAQASWDTRNALGYRVAPGLYPFNATETFYYDSGARPSLTVSATVEVRRGDISSFGFNWLTNYDSLLVDNTGTATIIQSDGQYLTYNRQPDGSYTAPPEDSSTLVRNADRTWTRTSKYGVKEWFNAQGRLIRVEDRNGNAQTLAYEPNGASLPSGAWGLTTRLLSITDASGRAMKFTYGADGYVSKVTDALGRQYTLAHDAAGNLTSITDPLGRVTTYQYDANHLMTHYTYPRSNSTALTYDSQGRVTRHTNALNQDRTATYGDGGNTFTDERGNPTTYQANPYGAITSVSNPVQTFNYTFDDRRQLVGTDPPLQRFTYDARGNLTDYSSYTHVGATYEPAYNLPTSVTDGAGNTTRFSYDARGNLIGVTDALGATYQSDYDSAGQLVRFTDPLSQTMRLEYDAFGNVTRLTDPLSFQSALAYDAAGNLTQITDAENHTTRYGYDSVDRLTSATDALGRITRYEYDGNDNLTHLTDARNNSTTYTYDALDRLTRKTDPLGNTTSYTYDGVGNRIRLTDANGATIQYTYDAASRLTAERYPDGSGVTYSYNPINDLTGFVDANILMTYTYPSAIPGRPDTVETRLVDNPNIRTTVTYDYVALGSVASLNQAATANGGNSVVSPQAIPPASRTEPAPIEPKDNQASGEQLTAPLSKPSTLLPTYPVVPPSESRAGSQDYFEARTATTTNVCGTISANTTWTLAGSPYIATCDVTVASGATLTIDPGVVVKFNNCCITLYVNGTLSANGTGAQPIYFTSLKDNSVGGNTSTGNPAPADWGGIRFSNSSMGNVLNNVVVRYGGGYWQNSVYVNTTAISLTNSTIAFGYVNGLMLDNTLPSSLSNNTFISNTGVALWAPLSGNIQSITLRGNSARGNAVNGFVTAGTISGTVSWDGDTQFPFVIWDGDLTVNSGARLTLTPRSVVKFRFCCNTLYVNGTLVADSDAANSVIFTSFKDDTVGGDTNGDGSASSPAPGDWGGIRFSNSSTGSLLNNAVVRYGGGYWQNSVYVNTTAISLTNSTIAFGYVNGLMLDNTLPASLSNNTFISNTGVALWAPLSGNIQSITLRGNSARGNTVNGFVTAGSIGGTVSWDGDTQFPFVVNSDLTINTGARLTLTPRTVVKFRYCCNTLYVNGTLVADSDAANSVVFTSLKDDSVGGDSNGDRSASSPGPGDWGGIRFSSSSTGSVLNNAVVRYGGGYWQNSVYVKTTAISLTNSTIAFGYVNGLMLDNTLPSSLSNNTFISNTNYAIYAPLNASTQSIVLRGNSARGNLVNGFVTNGSVGGNVSWDGDTQLPFVVDGDLTVNAGARLTLAPKTVVKFRACCNTLYVNGTLVADSDAANSVTFTSFKDDSVGGDTNGDGSASSPAPGDWGALRFANSSTGSVLNNAVVRYGGGYWQNSVYVNTANISFANNTIAFGYGNGLAVDGVSPTLTGNIFTQNTTGVYATNGARPILHGNKIFGNSQYGAYNADASVTIDAKNNWWGSSKGPYDPSDDRASGGLYNPTGDGNRVTDHVDYVPWQMISGLLYGTTIATGNNPAQSIRYSYDALNRLSSLTASGPASFVERYTYDAAGRLTAAGPTSGNPGVNTTMEYDAGSRLTRLTNRSPNGSTTFNDFRSTYDRVGNVLTVNDGSGITTYTYDTLNRLTSVSGPGLNETYTYDEVGNRQSKSSVTYTYNAANQLTSSSDGTTYSYDKNGNLRTKTAGGQATTYSWDIKDRLVRIDFSDGTFAAYTYDSLGNRLSKRDRSGTTTYYVYTGLNLVQELNAAGTVIASYVHGGLDYPISMTRGGATYYYLYDRLGNIVGLTDSAGALVVSYRYDPWGNVVATGGSNPNLANPFRFTGREWDAESGLYYYRARYYDPQVGRFLSRDPLRATARSNRYAYANNNPVVYTDPLGLGPEKKLSPPLTTPQKVGISLGISGGILGGTGAYTLATSGLALGPAGWLVGGVVLCYAGYRTYQSGKPPDVVRFVQRQGELAQAEFDKKVSAVRSVVNKFAMAGGKDQFTKPELEELGVIMENLTPDQKRQVLEAEGINYVKYAEALKQYNMLPESEK